MTRAERDIVVECGRCAELFTAAARRECEAGNLRNADWYVQLAQESSSLAFVVCIRSGVAA